MKKIFIIIVGLVAVALLFFIVTNSMNKSQKIKDTDSKSSFNIEGEVPESEIFSGGPGKDGIPSIDNPKFIFASEATFLKGDDLGLGLKVGDEKRFYPYEILVWNEIVNDTIDGVPVAVTYCPLCRTGVVYERKVDGEVVEFGVSGKLWKSNLLMYNRVDDLSQESLWSQVLGKAITGVHTGKKLEIVSSDTVKFGDWEKEYPDTKVLSRDTGSVRAYGTDPYGGYYESRDVSFGATFSDTRLHPKEFILGVELNGNFKAFVADSIPVGITTDEFESEIITITKSDIGEVRMEVNGEPLKYIGGFWFSWLAVHPDTELYK